jgi:hypothetical protein
VRAGVPGGAALALAAARTKHRHNRKASGGPPRGGVRRSTVRSVGRRCAGGRANVDGPRKPLQPCQAHRTGPLSTTLRRVGWSRASHSLAEGIAGRWTIGGNISTTATPAAAHHEAALDVYPCARWGGARVLAMQRCSVPLNHRGVAKRIGLGRSRPPYGYGLLSAFILHPSRSTDDCAFQRTRRFTD